MACKRSWVQVPYPPLDITLQAERNLSVPSDGRKCGQKSKGGSTWYYRAPGPKEPHSCLTPIARTRRATIRSTGITSRKTSLSFASMVATTTWESTAVPESREKYHRLLAERHAGADVTPVAKPETRAPADGLRVKELAVAYLPALRDLLRQERREDQSGSTCLAFARSPETPLRAHARERVRSARPRRPVRPSSSVRGSAATSATAGPN